jgi:Uma2 family endonuclease
VEPSPAPWHNLIRERIAARLRSLVQSSELGVVVQEMDFRLGPDTVRNPDVAVIATRSFYISAPRLLLP